VEDIKAYIESGILELYVLGDIPHDEKLQVEEMALKHPAVKAEIDEIERSMEQYAQINAVEPAEDLRSRVLGSILTNLGDDRNFPTKAEPAPVAKIIAMPTPATNSFYKYAFAACLALLLASGVALIGLYSKLQDSNTQIAVLTADKQHFANRVNLVEGQLGVLRDTSFKFLKLKGTAKAPAAVITVAWNPNKKKVWIDMGTAKIPDNDKAHQYQLWALVGGKPVDLGVFDENPDSTSDMKEMKSVANAAAFAVTLEPRGGSVNPTMDQMVVIGKF
jgi:anti-sigma-K factor RskA